MSVAVILVIVLSIAFIVGGIFISHLTSKAYYGDKNKEDNNKEDNK